MNFLRRFKKPETYFSKATLFVNGREVSPIAGAIYDPKTRALNVFTLPKQMPALTPLPTREPMVELPLLDLEPSRR